MKIIDLLNKIANGEEVPKKISAFGEIFYLKDSDYFTNDGCDYLLGDYVTFYELNTEIEIIEEPKKIEKVNTYVICDSDFNSKGEFSLKATEIIDKAFEEYSHKINEIIDYINEDNK